MGNPNRLNFKWPGKEPFLDFKDLESRWNKNPKILQPLFNELLKRKKEEESSLSSEMKRHRNKEFEDKKLLRTTCLDKCDNRG